MQQRSLDRPLLVGIGAPQAVRLVHAARCAALSFVRRFDLKKRRPRTLRTQSPPSLTTAEYAARYRRACGDTSTARQWCAV
jgi:hypothetical protein